MVGDLKPTLIIVLAATGLLLLLACVNVTNLLLARGASRVREMAARAALGASRGRLVRQLLTESAVLAATGAIAGLVLAFIGVRALLTYGASKLPRLEAVPFDTSVFLFVLLALVASALVVGIAPAFQLARTGLETLLNESGRSVRGSRNTHRTLRVLIVGEIAVAITLVAGSGWVVKSFANLQAIDPGFDYRGRLVTNLTLSFSALSQPGRGDHLDAHAVREHRHNRGRDCCRLIIDVSDACRHRRDAARPCRRRHDAACRLETACRQRGILRCDGHPHAPGPRLHRR